MLPSLLPLAPFRREHEGTGYRLIEGSDVAQANEIVMGESGLGTILWVLAVVFWLAVFWFAGRFLWAMWREAHPPGPPDFGPTPPPPTVKEVRLEEDEPSSDPTVTTPEHSRWRSL